MFRRLSTIVLVLVVALGRLALAAAAEPKEAGSKTKIPPKEITVDLGRGVKLEMVLIPSGEFLMGSPDSDKDATAYEKPQHRVRITKPFYLGKYPVTREQWQAVMGNDPGSFKAPKNPAETVTWDDCQEFVKKLNAKSGSEGGTFQMPTEAQWEYACRAGSITRYCFGDDELKLGEYAWLPGPFRQEGPDASRWREEAERLGAVRYARKRVGVVRRIGMMGVTMRSRRRMIRKGLQPARTALPVAASGPSTPRSAARRRASAACQGVRISSRASASACFRQTSDARGAQAQSQRALPTDRSNVEPSSHQLDVFRDGSEYHPILRATAGPLACGGHPHRRAQTPSEGVQPAILPFLTLGQRFAVTSYSSGHLGPRLPRPKSRPPLSNSRRPEKVVRPLRLLSDLRSQ